MIDGPGSSIVVVVEHIWLAVGEDGDKVIQGHEAEVRIIVAQLGQQLHDRAGRRVGGYARSHLEAW